MLGACDMEENKDSSENETQKNTAETIPDEEALTIKNNSEYKISFAFDEDNINTIHREIYDDDVRYPNISILKNNIIEPDSEKRIKRPTINTNIWLYIYYNDEQYFGYQYTHHKKLTPTTVNAETDSLVFLGDDTLKRINLKCVNYFYQSDMIIKIASSHEGLFSCYGSASALSDIPLTVIGYGDYTFEFKTEQDTKIIEKKLDSDNYTLTIDENGNISFS